MGKNNKNSETAKEIKEAKSTEGNHEEVETSETVPENEKAQGEKEKSYIAVYPIRCNGELIEANSEVSAEEFGDDFERLIEIGAIGELIDPKK